MSGVHPPLVHQRSAMVGMERLQGGQRKMRPQVDSLVASGACAPDPSLGRCRRPPTLQEPFLPCLATHFVHPIRSATTWLTLLLTRVRLILRVT